MRLNEINWANQLPYDRGDEDAEFVREFVAQFKLSALSGDLPALSAMVVQLDRQVSYSILPLELRIHVCRVLYEVVTTCTLDFALFDTCCGTLGRVLRNEDTITPSDMSLDWRKLYDLMCSLLRPKIWQDGPIQQR
ncbi:hypothetical protein IWQ57_003440 [Coemansia nantahalensis]|uniref:Uncharacterized protein n=1 Tax=Coemansia nantahalensis TaxID=2789366 RepID=A0ACC1JWD9_9FUNG|nr:hypothetical protein IWQ57_003440 [Coemansia nantahalensis]